MYKITGICDRCKKEETIDGKYFPLGKDWGEVKLEISQYEHKRYLFCKDCRLQLGLLKPETDKTNEKPRIETVEEKLFNCISEIVQEVAG